MDEVFRRRIVGLLVLAAFALFLSWVLPRPGLDTLEQKDERVVAMDLTRPDAPPQDLSRPGGEGEAASSGRRTASGTPPWSETVPEDGRAPAPADGDASGANEAAEPDLHGAEAPPQAKPVPATLPPPKPATAAPKSTTQTPSPAPAAPAVAPKPATPAAPKPAPAAVPKPTAPVPAATPAPKPAAPAAVKPTEAPAAIKPTASPDEVGDGPWFVQVGAFSEKERAQSVLGTLKARGLACGSTAGPGAGGKGTLHRVRCGPYLQRTEADAVVGHIQDVAKAQVVGAGR